ncbi:hypothetical protein DFO67_1328 [Modicisalibacter xianhensis]|uniref:Uncharacterized protein n=1 Tax=Modicisalibacter xianhensis TaxID=442341 RepID=A0A4R8F8V2_9GAMM|nr:hypothetical protein [Halomonas xianhensis]TDX21889.1 hypothetical protein DFO67_1328 [Halomonas xianhensis]
MQVFSGKIRPRGELGTEVVRKDLTAPEVMVLKELHGEDGVVDLQLVRSDNRRQDDEYGRIVRKYGRTDAGRAAISSLFGSPQNPNVPTSLKGFKETASTKVNEKAEGK